MISLEGQIPVSIPKASIILFAQDYVRKTTCPDIVLKYFTISVDVSSFVLENCHLIGADNQVDCILKGQLSCKLKSKLFDKQILVIGKLVIRFIGLEISESKQVENIQIQIESLKFQGIPSLLIKTFLAQANDAINQFLIKELPVINQVILLNLKKTYSFDFELANQIFKNLLGIEKVKITSLEDDSMYFKLKIGFKANLVNNELSHTLLPILSKNNNNSDSITIGFSQDLLADILSKYIQNYTIPLLHKNLAFKLLHVNIGDQSIKIGIAIIKIFEASYDLEFSISSNKSIIKLHLLKIQPKHSASLLQLGISKAIQFGIRKRLDEVGEIDIALIKSKVKEYLKSSYHFKTNVADINMNIPDFELANIWLENHAICFSIEWKDVFYIDL